MDRQTTMMPAEELTHEHRVILPGKNRLRKSRTYGSARGRRAAGLPAATTVHIKALTENLLLLFETEQFFGIPVKDLFSVLFGQSQLIDESDYFVRTSYRVSIVCTNKDVLGTEVFQGTLH